MIVCFESESESMGITCEIEFRRDLCLVREVPGCGSDMRLLNVPKGTRLRVGLRGYHKGIREVADLYLADGSVVRELSYGLFHFVPTAHEFPGEGASECEAA